MRTCDAARISRSLVGVFALAMSVVACGDDDSTATAVTTSSATAAAATSSATAADATANEGSVASSDDVCADREASAPRSPRCARSTWLPMGPMA